MFTASPNPDFTLDGVYPWGRTLDVTGLRDAGLDAEIVGVDFEFQKGGNRMLRVRSRSRSTP